MYWPLSMMSSASGARADSIFSSRVVDGAKAPENWLVV